MASPVRSIVDSAAAIAARAALLDVVFDAPVEQRRLICCHFLSHADGALWPHVMTSRKAFKYATDALRQAVVVTGGGPYPPFVAISIGVAMNIVLGLDAECKEADWQLAFAKKFLEEAQALHG